MHAGFAQLIRNTRRLRRSRRLGQIIEGFFSFSFSSSSSLSCSVNVGGVFGQRSSFFSFSLLLPLCLLRLVSPCRRLRLHRFLSLVCVFRKIFPSLSPSLSARPFLSLSLSTDKRTPREKQRDEERRRRKQNQNSKSAKGPWKKLDAVSLCAVSFLSLDGEKKNRPRHAIKTATAFPWCMYTAHADLSCVCGLEVDLGSCLCEASVFLCRLPLPLLFCPDRRRREGKGKDKKKKEKSVELGPSSHSG